MTSQKACKRQRCDAASAETAAPDAEEIEATEEKPVAAPGAAADAATGATGGNPCCVDAGKAAPQMLSLAALLELESVQDSGPRK